MSFPAVPSMTRAEIQTLLAVVSAYDARTVGVSEVESWHQAAARARWTYDEAVEQVHQFFAFDVSGKWLMPGSVTALIRTARQDQAARKAAEMPNPTRHINGGAVVGDDPDWGRANSAALEDIHREASVVACPSCKQGIGERCRNTITGNATKIPHPARLVSAKKAVTA